MASWNTKITLPNGTITFMARDEDIPQAAKDSVFWTQCSDGNWYYNRGAFAGGVSICEQLRIPTAQPDTNPPGFIKTYGAEPGPVDHKNVWKQARSTFVSDSLPEGWTAAEATRITQLVHPYGLPPARFFVNNYGHRCLFRNDASSNATTHYLDYPAESTNDQRLDDTVAAWQSAIALSDPSSFPGWAIIAPWLPASIAAILEAAQGA